VPIILTWAIVSIGFGVKLKKVRFDYLNIICIYGKAEKVSFGPNLT